MLWGPVSLKVVVNEGTKETELLGTEKLLWVIKKVEDHGYTAVESLEKPSPAENRNVSSEQINLAKDISRLIVKSDN